MNITLKDRFAYIVENSGLYFVAINIYREEGQKPSYRMSQYKGDGKKFDSIGDAAEVSRLIGGSRIVRYDKLTMQTVTVRDVMRQGVEREWKEA